MKMVVVHRNHHMKHRNLWYKIKWKTQNKNDVVLEVPDGVQRKNDVFFVKNGWLIVKHGRKRIVLLFLQMIS